MQACAHRAEGGLSAYLLPDGFCIGPVQAGQVRVLRNHAEFDIATVLDTRANVRMPSLPLTILGDGAWRSIKVTGISLGIVALLCSFAGLIASSGPAIVAAHMF